MNTDDRRATDLPRDRREATREVQAPTVKHPSDPGCTSPNDEAVWRELLHSVQRVAESQCQNRSEADDVTQEVMLRLLRRKTTLDPTSAQPLIWLIVRQAHIDQIRKESRRVGTVPTDYLEFAADDSGLIAGEVLLAVQQLPAQERIALVMKHLLQLTYRDIAVELRVSPSTAFNRVEHAKRLLRASLKEWNPSHRHRF